MIRYASASDIPRIVEFAAIEHALSPWADIAFDPQHTAETVEGFVVGMGRTAMISAGGYLLGLMQPLGFSKQMAAMEYALFANDGSGMQLLHTFEDWARRMGAVTVVTHDYTGGDDRLARVLERRCGYTRIGAALSRRLEN